MTNQNDRFGGATLGGKEHLLKAGMFKKTSTAVHLGFWEKQPFYLDADGPIITYGGARSGKLRDIIAYTACTYRGRAIFVDLKGEIAAISIENQVRLGKRAYCINPRRLHGLPAHKVNVLDHLMPRSPSLAIDCQLAAFAIVSVSSPEEAEKWWIRTARRWVEKILHAHVLRYGHVSITELYRLINLIEASPHDWIDFQAFMATCGHTDIASAANEIHNKILKAGGGKDSDAPLVTIRDSLSYMTDPAMQECLGPNPDFSLEDICDPENPIVIYLIVPAEYVEILGSFIRSVFETTSLYKSRHPDSPRVLFVVDEAAQLKFFEPLLRATVYGPGSKLRVWSIWQDVGQTARNFGSEAVQTFMGSAQVRQFLGGGVRDYPTAQLVSSMMGTETLSYDPTMQQEEARHSIREAVEGMLNGDNALHTARQLAHLRKKSQHQEKQARLLRTPDEVMNLADNRQLLFISGIGAPGPFEAWRYPYWRYTPMAGQYMPNPYHPPLDSVVVPGRLFGSKRRIITARVPRKYRDWPQYQETGTWKYVKGYRYV